MRLIKAVTLCSLVLTTSGCTVLGIFADTAIQSVYDNNNNDRHAGRTYKGKLDPYFTNKGLEQDVKLAKILMAKLPEKELKPVSQQVNQMPILACKNVMDGKQQCHPPEYYEDMYIKDTRQEEEPQPSKD